MEREILPVSQTLLETIKESVESFAELIAKTMDADVLIVDNNLNVIAKTSLYFRLYSPVDLQCVIGQVLISQKKILVEDRKKHESCMRCPSYEECRIAGMIGVPVFYNGRIIGAVALILPRHRVPLLFGNVERATEFMENTAAVMTEGLRYNDEYSAIRRETLEKEQVLDNLDAGLVYTDNMGEIQYCNRAFRELFGVHESCLGENILTLLPHRILRDYLQDRRPIRNLKVSMEHAGSQFFGFLTCTESLIYGENRHLIFSFRSISNIWADASAAGIGSMVTLEWCRGWLFEDSVLERAKALAVTEQPVLIQGPQNSINEMASKAICNYSDRSAMGMVNVYCNNIYREFFEQFLFSRFGEIQRANHGTLVLYQVENLPLYLQERLLAFMKTRELLLEDSQVLKCDVRLIFTTTANLKELCERGFFLEELYYRLEYSTLLLAPVQESRTRLAALLDSGLEFYKSRYGKPSVALSKEAKLKLLNRSWGNDPNEIEKTLERIVRDHDGLVTGRELIDIRIDRAEGEGVSAISEMEKEKIEKLLSSGYSKVEIARMLGIGRATLYRKMAEYHLK